MHLEERLHENVYLYSDVLEDPDRLLQLVHELDSVEEVHEVIPEWGFWFSSSEDGSAYGSLKVFNPERLDALTSDRKEDAAWVINQVKNAIEGVSEAFYRDYGKQGSPNVDSSGGVSMYRPGCTMGAHFDAQGGDESVEWSIIIYANDDYSGGEISFIIRPYDLRNPNNGHLRPRDDANHPLNKELVDFTVAPKKGQALVFPPTHPYMHQVHTVKEGQKYIIPGFIYKPEFDPKDPESREKYNFKSEYRKISLPIKYFDED